MGSGTTPLTINLTQRYEKCAIILRGYKRDSSGLIVVSLWGESTCSVKTAGDEAYEYAKAVKNSLVIVSEDRIKAIKKAKELGAKVIFLDDGFNKNMIKKFDILIHQNFTNHFCLPSGPYKEPIWLYNQCDFLARENVDFTREVHVQNPTEKMVLITAIANPKRLDAFLPLRVEKFYFPDHHSFTKDEIEQILHKTSATSILTTQKDLVKLEEFGFNYSLLKLTLHVDEKMVNQISKYINSYK